MGTTRVIPRSATKNFNAFLSWIALPAVYFNAMATLDPSGLHGGILLTILVSKVRMCIRNCNRGCVHAYYNCATTV